MSNARGTFQQLVADEIDKDLPAREVLIAKAIGIIGGLAVPILLSFGPIIGGKGAQGLAAVTAVVPVYYILVLVLHRVQGTLPKALTWCSTVIDVSAPAAAVYVGCLFISPVYAFTDASLPIFAGMVSLSALRTPRHPLFGGFLAAVLYFAVFLVFRPDLIAPELLGLSVPNVALRSGFLFVCGVLASITATQLRKKIEGAVRAARERDVFGKYVLHERIGAGGMAEVFRATYALEGGFARQVAIKRILPGRIDDPQYAALFRREAKVSAMLAHPNIVQVHDMGSFDGQLYLAMEYIDGVTLRGAILRARRLPLEVATFVIGQVALALDYMHARRDYDGRPMGLVHRDVNPANIMLSTAGDVKLTDFGIVLGEGGTRLTTDGSVRGKMGYIAPEQFRDELPTARADIYALGISLYECAAGLDPVGFREDHRSALHATLRGEIDAPSSKVKCTEQFDDIVLSMLRVDTSERPSSGREVYEMLMQLPQGERPAVDGREQVAALADQYRAIKRGRAKIEVGTDVQPLTPGHDTEGRDVDLESLANARAQTDTDEDDVPTEAW